MTFTLFVKNIRHLILTVIASRCKNFPKPFFSIIYIISFKPVKIHLQSNNPKELRNVAPKSNNILPV